MGWVVGVDENGLGPRLGPLVATAVCLELPKRNAKAVGAAAEGAGIADSKLVSGFGKMAWAEGVALATVARQEGRVPRDADELFAALSLDGLLAMRSPCPKGSAPQCWSEPVPLPAYGGSRDDGERALDALAKAGARVVRARSAIACVRVYDEGVARRGSKVALDLELFERLILDARAATDADLDAMCGMVGGIRQYLRYFSRFDPITTGLIEESRLRARYRVPGVGRVTFEVDADASHPAVALASMIGKYVRELGMDRITRFYRRAMPELEPVSGYHDPKTAHFIDKTTRMRRRLRIADQCFERGS